MSVGWPSEAFALGAARISCGLRLRLPSAPYVPRTVEALAGGAGTPLLAYADIELVVDLDAREVSIQTRPTPKGAESSMSPAERHAVEMAMLVPHRSRAA